MMRNLPNEKKETGVLTICANVNFKQRPSWC